MADATTLNGVTIEGTQQSTIDGFVTYSAPLNIEPRLSDVVETTLDQVQNGNVTEEQGRKSALHALDQGVQILRTQGVRETRQVLDLWERLIASGK